MQNLSAAFTDTQRRVRRVRRARRAGALPAAYHHDRDLNQIP